MFIGCLVFTNQLTWLLIVTQPTRKSPYDKKSTVNNNVIMQAYFLAVDCIGSGSIIFGAQTVHVNEDIVNK